MAPLGKALIVFGLVIVVIGLLVWSAGSFASIPVIGRLGRLPGDIYLRHGNFTLYFPITTAIVVSIVVSLLLALLRR